MLLFRLYISIFYWFRFLSRFRFLLDYLYRMISLLNEYLTQLSMFDGQQHVTGFSGMVFGGLGHMQNSTVNTKTMIYTGTGR